MHHGMSAPPSSLCLVAEIWASYRQTSLRSALVILRSPPVYSLSQPPVPPNVTTLVSQPLPQSLHVPVRGEICPHSLHQYCPVLQYQRTLLSSGNISWTDTSQVLSTAVSTSPSVSWMAPLLYEYLLTRRRHQWLSTHPARFPCTGSRLSRMDSTEMSAWVFWREFL